MATVVRADISGVLNLLFGEPIADQFRRDVVVFNLLNIRPDRNATCTWRAKFAARTAGGAYAEGADMADADFDSHDRVQASLNWAEYRKGVKISGLAQSVAAASGAPGDMSLWDEELRDAIDDLALDLGADLYAGDPSASPTELAGAATAIDSTGVFAGIDPATYPDWAAGENTLATSSLSISKLRQLLHRPVKDAVGTDPEFVTCPGAVFDLIKDLFADSADVIQQVRTNARGTVDIYAATGARAVSIDGVPYIEDRHCTANTLYAWHSRWVEIRYIPAVLPPPVRLVTALKNLTGVDVPQDEVERRLRSLRGPGVLPPTIEMLAQTGDAYKAMVKVYPQVAWRRRNAFAKLVLT